MAALAVLCLATGLLPGLVIDALSEVVSPLVGGRMPEQVGIPWLSIVPVAAGRSSYNGLLVFAFVAIAAGGTAAAIRRFASRQARRAPAWDCGYPDPSPATQYSAGSFAQPVRRVFAAVLSSSETVVMPQPGDQRSARLTVVVRDLVWDGLYRPIVVAVNAAADRLNQLQFLTIRRYLSLVFAALVGLLVVLAVWQ
jgi:hypothetical protein